MGYIYLDLLPSLQNLRYERVCCGFSMISWEDLGRKGGEIANMDIHLGRLGKLPRVVSRV